MTDYTLGGIFTVITDNFITPNTNFDDPQVFSGRSRHGCVFFSVMDEGLYEFEPGRPPTYVYWCEEDDTGDHGPMFANPQDGEYIFQVLDEGTFAWKVGRFKRRNMRKGKHPSSAIGKDLREEGQSGREEGV